MMDSGGASELHLSPQKDLAMEDSSLSWLYYRYEGRLNPFHLSYLPGISELESYFMKNEDSIYQFLVIDGWWLLSLPLGLIYVVGIFALQAAMKDKERFNLRYQLIAWNVALALFSILGTMRLSPEFFDMLRTKGFYGSTCDSRYMSGDGMMWAWLFVFSKVPEMGDTLFIVLRKQKLIFLHWYHHVITFWFCMLCYINQTSIGRWFMVMNYFVHSVMYSYYALKAAKIYVPKKVSMGITSLQLSQMVVGFSVSLSALYWRRAGVPCDASYTSLYTALIMYFSYVILFANFFFWAYRSYLVRFWHKYVKTETGEPLANGDAKHLSNGFIPHRNGFRHVEINGKKME